MSIAVTAEEPGLDELASLMHAASLALDGNSSSAKLTGYLSALSGNTEEEIQRSWNILIDEAEASIQQLIDAGKIDGLWSRFPQHASLKGAEVLLELHVRHELEDPFDDLYQHLDFKVKQSSDQASENAKKDELQELLEVFRARLDARGISLFHQDPQSELVRDLFNELVAANLLHESTQPEETVSEPVQEQDVTGVPETYFDEPAARRERRSGGARKPGSGSEIIILDSAQKSLWTEAVGNFIGASPHLKDLQVSPLVFLPGADPRDEVEMYRRLGFTDLHGIERHHATYEMCAQVCRDNNLPVTLHLGEAADKVTAIGPVGVSNFDLLGGWGNDKKAILQKLRPNKHSIEIFNLQGAHELKSIQHELREGIFLHSVEFLSCLARATYGTAKSIEVMKQPNQSLAGWISECLPEASADLEKYESYSLTRVRLRELPVAMLRTMGMQNSAPFANDLQFIESTPPHDFALRNTWEALAPPFREIFRLMTFIQAQATINRLADPEHSKRGYPIEALGDLMQITEYLRCAHPIPNRLSRLFYSSGDSTARQPYITTMMDLYTPSNKELKDLLPAAQFFMKFAEVIAHSLSQGRSNYWYGVYRPEQVPSVGRPLPSHYPSEKIRDEDVLCVGHQQSCVARIPISKIKEAVYTFRQLQAKGTPLKDLLDQNIELLPGTKGMTTSVGVTA